MKALNVFEASVILACVYGAMLLVALVLFLMALRRLSPHMLLSSDYYGDNNEHRSLIPRSAWRPVLRKFENPFISAFGVRLMNAGFFALVAGTGALRLAFFIVFAVELSDLEEQLSNETSAAKQHELTRDSIVLSSAGKKLFFVLPAYLGALGLSMVVLLWVQIVLPYSIGMLRKGALAASSDASYVAVQRRRIQRACKVRRRRWAAFFITINVLSLSSLAVSFTFTDAIEHSAEATRVTIFVFCFVLALNLLGAAALYVYGRGLFSRFVKSHLQQGIAVLTLLFIFLRIPLLLVNVFAFDADAFEYYDRAHAEATGPAPVLRVVYFVFCEALPLLLIMVLQRRLPEDIGSRIENPYPDSLAHSSSAHPSKSRKVHAATVSDPMLQPVRALSSITFASESRLSIGTDFSDDSENVSETNRDRATTSERYWERAELHELLSIDARTGLRKGGSAANVYRCTTPDGATWACKIMQECNKQDLDALSREGGFYKTLSNHPNIVRMVHSSSSPEIREVRLFLQYFQFSLADIISERCSVSEINGNSLGFEVVEVAIAGLDLAHGLLHIHSHHICHRDIKPENIFCETKIVQVKGSMVRQATKCLIGDFDVSKRLPSVRTRSPQRQLTSSGDGTTIGSLGNDARAQLCASSTSASSVTGATFWSGQGGTTGFVGPELLFSNDDEPIYSTSVDVYSLGVVLWLLLLGKKTPEQGSTREMWKELTLPLEFTESPDKSTRKLARLVAASLQTEPKRRPSAQQIAAQFQNIIAAVQTG